jgi:hypothetical protein
VRRFLLDLFLQAGFCNRSLAMSTLLNLFPNKAAQLELIVFPGNEVFREVDWLLVNERSAVKILARSLD